MKYRTLTPNLVSQPLPLFPAWWSCNSGTLHMTLTQLAFYQAQDHLFANPKMPFAVHHLCIYKALAFHVILPLQVEIHIQAMQRPSLPAADFGRDLEG